MSDPSVAAVVVAWNRLDDTRRCVASLRASDPAPTVIVVDNGSAPPLSLPDVHVIRSERNLGFAGGANLGIRAALDRGAAFVWLVNNDAEVEPEALRALLAEAERDPRVGIVGGVVRDRSGDVHTWGGGRLAWTAVTTLVRDPQPIDFVTGACMLLRRELLEDVGLFDERYFFYYEDADLCRRATASGWRAAVAPGARVVHTVGATVDGGAERSERADVLQAESGGIFIGKHRGVSAWPTAAVRAAGIAANRLARRQPRRISPLVRALFRGVQRGRAAGGRVENVGS